MNGSAHTTRVPLDRICTDATQTRAAINYEVVKEYAAAYSDGGNLPPIVLFSDGNDLWIGDGFHRCAGAKLAEQTDIEAEVREGTQRDAILFGVGCNHTHGLRRTNEDKANAVRMLLALKDWADKSHRLVAEACNVSDHFVANIRASMGSSSTAHMRSSKTREGKDGKKRRTKPKSRPRNTSKKTSLLVGLDVLLKSGPLTPKFRPKLEALSLEQQQILLEHFTATKDAVAAMKAATAEPSTEPETIAEEINRTASTIESFCRKLMALVDAEMPADAWLDKDGIRNGAIQKFKDGCGMLRLAKCTHICPVCKGTRLDGGKKCSKCLGTGRMPKSAFDQAA